ncbi:hypothetical protein Ciccas_013664 [Cichlidogyrus casuarinus]|uniref:RRM domain-containing protein n=1 Tax=Cichlidogyrus casuarinus TaxID=1844966 RepID=A0ABD2PN28_9PLAT
MKDEKFRKLFVGGLSPRTDKQALALFFGQWGEIEDCVVMVLRGEQRRSRGFGFVTYREPHQLDLAQSFRPHVIDGKVVESKRAMPREDSSSPEAHLTVTKLYVTQPPLPKPLSKDTLLHYFGQFGCICSIDLSPQETLIEFQDYDSVDKVILHRPHSVQSCPLIVKKALRPEQVQAIKAKYEQQCSDLTT